MKKTNITIDDIWKIKRPTGLSISPDASQVVCSLTSYDMAENTSSAALWLLSTFGGEARQLTACGDKDGQAAWSPDGKQIAFVSKRVGDDAPQLYVIAPDGGEARRVTKLATGVAGIKWFPNSKKVAFISWVWPDLSDEKSQAKRLFDKKNNKVSAHVVTHSAFRHWDHWLSDGRVPHVHVVDMVSGKSSDLFRDSEYELPQFDTDQHEYDIAPDGKTIAFNFNPNVDKRGDQAYDLVEMNVNTRNAITLIKGAKYTWHHPRYSPDGNSIALLTNNIARSMDDDNKLALFDRATQKIRVKTTWDRVVNHPLKWSHDSCAVYFTADEASRLSLYQWTLTLAAPTIVSQGGTVSDFDVGATTLTVVKNNMSCPPKVFVCNEGGELAIETFNDALMANFKLGDVREYTVRGWNNEPVQMWAVFPPNFDETNKKKTWPLLHSIHGGPHANWGDNFHFRWNNHVFAAQGYVVICVNYHGSLGWGNQFLESNNGSFGTKEHADVEAGTDFMLREFKGVVDKNRLAASGGSYGGKMVAWMNGRNNKKRGGDRYKAYVCHAGCFDWRAMYGGDAGYWFNYSLKTAYWQDSEKFAAQNPITEIQHAKTPTLVMHGALDYRVPDQQGLAYYSTLKSLNVPTKLVFFPDENHWIIKPQNSRLWYREYFAWLKKYV